LAATDVAYLYSLLKLCNEISWRFVMSATTASPANADEVRSRVHQMWGAVAAAWDEHADEVERRSAAVTRSMIDAIAPRPGDDVLELACGAGGLGLAIADRVGPAGSVLLTDVAPEMVKIAAARASRRGDDGGGSSHVTARVADLEQIDLPGESFDIVVCREGLMFALDAGRALREMDRVLRPGGRLAVAVWGPRNRNPWLEVLVDAIQEHTGVQVPPPGVPGPFSLGGDGQLERTLIAAGLEQIQVTEVAVPTHDASFDEYWQVRIELAGPMKRVLSSLSTEKLAAIRETVRQNVSQFVSADGALAIPGLAYVASATRSAGSTG
jgi:ubiquinone/menaquinone biosynthesis C-methylase UbiE